MDILTTSISFKKIIFFDNSLATVKNNCGLFMYGPLEFPLWTVLAKVLGNKYE